MEVAIFDDICESFLNMAYYENISYKFICGSYLVELFPIEEDICVIKILYYTLAPWLKPPKDYSVSLRQGRKKLFIESSSNIKLIMGNVAAICKI